MRETAFVPAIARKGDRHFLPRHSTDKIRRQHRRISEGLLHHARQIRDRLFDVRVYHHLVVLGSESLRHDSCILRLVKAVLGKTDRECLDWSRTRLCHQRHDD